VGRIIEERLEQFHRRAIDRTQRAGLCAYLLSEDGSVVRYWPNGKNEKIVSASTSRTLSLTYVVRILEAPASACQSPIL
jgi:hypothetical protein